MSLNTTDLSAGPARAVSTNDGRVRVGSVEELNALYGNAGPSRTLAVGGRHETRAGQLFCLGGLDWLLSDGPLVAVLTTGEDEVLPDLPVVRAAWPVAKSFVAAAGIGVAA